MPTDEAALASVCQANERYAADYERRLAAETVAMLVNIRSDAWRVLALVDAMLNLELRVSEPPPSEPQLHDAA
jgi:hypothetical protein